MQGVEKCLNASQFFRRRDLAKIQQITDAIESVDGVKLWMWIRRGHEPHRRNVRRRSEAALEAAFRHQKGITNHRMSTHHGAHPAWAPRRVPLRARVGLTLDDCAELADRSESA